MTHIVLKGMVERKRGVILNVSSLSAKFLSSLNTLYGATKVNIFEKDKLIKV